MGSEYIKEGNAIIAKFCNLKRNKPSESNAIEWWEKQDDSILIPHIEYRCFMPKLFFHKSWDWLMPVIDKIERELFVDGKNLRVVISTTVVRIDEFEMRIFEGEDKLLKTWECIVEYLKMNVVK